MDGTPTLRMNEFVLAHAEATAKAPAQTHSDGATASLLEPVELKFIINDEIRDFVKAAEERFDTLVGEHELNVRSFVRSDPSYPISSFRNPFFFIPFLSFAHLLTDILADTHTQVLHYTPYGKSLITSKFKVSPDAWVQLVKQLAWYKTFRRCVSYACPRSCIFARSCKPLRSIILFLQPRYFRVRSDFVVFVLWFGF